MTLALPAPVQVPLVGGAPLVDALFVARPNRFVVEAELGDGQVVAAHVADRGRLLWLRPGLPLWLGHKPAAGRKTAYQVAAVQRDGVWSSLDTHLPNALVAAAVVAGALPQFAGYPTMRREATYGASRFDLELRGAGAPCVIEIKSVGDVSGGVAAFPDAPTVRGSRHLHELIALRAAGVRTALVFVVQHAGGQVIEANRAIDPDFAQALSDALAAGVEVYGYACRIERAGITLGSEIPVRDVLRAAVGGPIAHEETRP